jgi:hypothetical protein
MKTMSALLGSASALALVLALSQGASASGPDPVLDDNQVNVASNGNANDGSTITKTWTDNSNNSVNVSDDDSATTSNSFNYTNREDKTVNVRKDVDIRKDEKEAKADDGSAAAVNGNATNNSIGYGADGDVAGRDLNSGTQVSLGDVLLNLTSANANLNTASMGAALQAKIGTGYISNVSLNGAHGVNQVSANTGIASQANNIAINSVVK